MAKEQFDRFYARAAKLERARGLGYGFEAVGTLGRSHYVRPHRRRLNFIAPAVVIACCFFGVKATMHADLGHEGYDLRVERMIGSGGLEHIGGLMMQADPVTVWLSDRMGQYLG